MRKTSLVFMICLFCASAFSQVSLTGPECAMPGLSYQYLISGKWDSSSKMHVCVTGGAIAGGSTCTADGPPLSSVVVIWNEKATGGTITVTSTSGNASKSIGITTSISPGSIAQADKSRRTSPVGGWAAAPQAQRARRGVNPRGGKGAGSGCCDRRGSRSFR